MKWLTLLLSLATLSIPEVNAQSADDWYLISKLREQGVRVDVNHYTCKGSDYAGRYSSNDRQIIICVDDNDWTLYDSDTLIHETQHYIQDCYAGYRFDNKFAPIYREPIDLARQFLTIQQRVELYMQYNDPDYKIELEAWSVAKQMDYDKVLYHLDAYCKFNRKYYQEVSK